MNKFEKMGVVLLIAIALALYANAREAYRVQALPSDVVSSQSNRTPTGPIEPTPIESGGTTLIGPGSAKPIGPGGIIPGGPSETPTSQYNGTLAPPDGVYTLEIQNGRITKIGYQPFTKNTMTEQYSQQDLLQGSKELPDLAAMLGSLWGCDVGCWKSGYRGQAYEDCCEKCWAGEGYVISR